MLFCSAEVQDYAMLKEIEQVLSQPYAEQSDELTKKYYQKTPGWARQLPGVTFMS